LNFVECVFLSAWGGNSNSANRNMFGYCSAKNSGNLRVSSLKVVVMQTSSNLDDFGKNVRIGKTSAECRLRVFSLRMPVSQSSCYNMQNSCAIYIVTVSVLSLLCFCRLMFRKPAAVDTFLANHYIIGGFTLGQGSPGPQFCPTFRAQPGNLAWELCHLSPQSRYGL